jgi:hypothetical protein
MSYIPEVSEAFSYAHGTEKLCTNRETFQLEASNR